MELVAIHLARVVAFLEVESLDPKGSTTPPEGLRALGSRYAFEKLPENLSSVDFTKGAIFSSGRFKNIAIDQIVVYNNGVLIDTRSSTENSLVVLLDMLEFAKQSSGAVIVPKRMHFISQIVFRSALKIAFLNPLLQPIADRLSQVSSKALSTPIHFEPTSVIIGADTSQIKVTPSPFSIERRAEVPFNENTYFSAAPLTTPEHMKLIEEVEAALTVN